MRSRASCAGVQRRWLAVSTAEIPFNKGQASGIDELAGALPMAINMLVDAGGAAFTRPGLLEWDEWPDPSCDDAGAGAVIGAAVWNSAVGEFLVYVTTDRRIWAMLGPNNRIALSDPTAATQLDGTTRPTFASTITRIVIAGGGLIQKWEGAGLSARLGGSPPVASHVVANSRRLVVSAPIPPGEITFSETGDTGHEVWNTGDSDSAEAEARPDLILATHENSNEVYAFGSETLQLFVPDPVSAYNAGRASNFGLAAAYSVIRAGESFLLLAVSDGRVLAATDGRGLTPLSEGLLDKALARFETVADCWGFRAKIDAWDLAVWVFPTEGRTLVYDAITQQWSEWRSRSGGAWVPWAGTAHVYWPSRNLNLVGLTDGTMALLDGETFQDVGEPLVGLVRTGHMDRGSKKQKVCQGLALTMRRGGNASPAPAVAVRWREGLGAFSQPLTYSLGANGETEATLRKWTLGVYTDRQWLLEFSANARLVLAAATETYEEAEL